MLSKLGSQWFLIIKHFPQFFKNTAFSAIHMRDTHMFEYSHEHPDEVWIKYSYSDVEDWSRFSIQKLRSTITFPTQPIRITPIPSKMPNQLTLKKQLTNTCMYLHNTTLFISQFLVLMMVEMNSINHCITSIISLQIISPVTKLSSDILYNVIRMFIFSKNIIAID